MKRGTNPCILALLLVSGCAGTCSETPKAAPPAVTADGYKTAAKGDMRIEWKIDGANLRVRLSARTKGWVGVGFDPSTAMKDANFIIGYVKDGQAFIRDDFGAGMFSHKADTDLGGKDNVTEKSGTEKDGVTSLAFTIPLDSGDATDRPLAAGKSAKVLLACGNDDADDFTTKHHDGGSVVITL